MVYDNKFEKIEIVNLLFHAALEFVAHNASTMQNTCHLVYLIPNVQLKRVQGYIHVIYFPWTLKRKNNSVSPFLILFRVVKSSWLLVNITAYLVSIGRLLCLAFLYGWRFLIKTSLDWPLYTLTTQPSTSKLSDNPVSW